MGNPTIKVGVHVYSFDSESIGYRCRSFPVSIPRCLGRDRRWCRTPGLLVPVRAEGGGRAVGERLDGPEVPGQVPGAGDVVDG